VNLWSEMALTPSPQGVHAALQRRNMKRKCAVSGTISENF
jgi:hypothetical protein